MRKVALCAAVCFSILIALAQETEQNKKIIEALKNKKISLRFQKTPLIQAIEFLRETTGLNFVIDPECDKETDVDINLINVTVEQLLKLMLVPKGLDYVVKEGAVFVSTKERIVKLWGKREPPPPTDIKTGQILLVLKDDSRFKVAASITELRLKTAYGLLTIPVKDILRIRFPFEPKEGETEKPPKEDEVQTVRFTVTGVLEVEKFDVESECGKLTIPKTDVKEIWFPIPRKEFEVKPTGEWVDTGIALKKGDKVKITAEGVIKWAIKGRIVTFKPDGSADGWDKDWKEEPPSLALLGRIGERERERERDFKVGAYKEVEVEQDGNLYLMVPMRGLNDELMGSYKVEVAIGR